MFFLSSFVDFSVLFYFFYSFFNFLSFILNIFTVARIRDLFSVSPVLRLAGPYTMGRSEALLPSGASAGITSQQAFQHQTLGNKTHTHSQDKHQQTVTDGVLQTRSLSA